MANIDWLVLGNTGLVSYHGEAAFMPDAMAAARDAELVHRMAEDEVTQGAVDGAQIVRDLRRARGMAEDTSIPHPTLVLMAERDAAMARAEKAEKQPVAWEKIIVDQHYLINELRAEHTAALALASEWETRALAAEQRLTERDASAKRWVRL